MTKTHADAANVVMSILLSELLIVIKKCVPRIHDFAKIVVNLLHHHEKSLNSVDSTQPTETPKFQAKTLHKSYLI